MCGFSKPLLFSLLAYGKFTFEDVLMTQKSLVTFSLGITGFMLIKLLGSAFYATQNVKTPVKIGVYAMIFNSILCLLFIKPLAHAGLALASSLAGMFNAGMLLRLLIKNGSYQPSQGWVKFLGQLVGANAVLGIALFFLATVIDWMSYPAAYRLVLLLFMVIVAMIIYFITLYLFGLRPSDFRGKVKT